MAITLTPVIESVNKSRGHDTRRFYVPSVIAGASVVSPEYLLPLTPNGIIIGLKIQCNSLAYDFYLTAREGMLPASATSPDIVYSQLAINKTFGYKGTGEDSISPNEFNIFYSNRDIPIKGALYLTVVNKDAVNATGVGYITLTISQD